jgi:hypothetical protein
VDATGVRGRRIGQRFAAFPQVHSLDGNRGWRVSALQLAGSTQKRQSGGAFALLVLFADAVFFLVLVAAGIGSVIWLPAFYYLYLLAEAVFVYRAPEVLVVAVVSVIFCVAVQSQNVFPIRRTAVVMGALAYGFAVYKKRLESRMTELEREAGATKEDARRAREAERQRIASDFHDGPLQSFISLQMRLEILRKVLERDLGAGMDDLQRPAGAGAATGKGIARFRPEHAPAGHAGIQPIRLGAADLRKFSKGERHSGVVRGRRGTPEVPRGNGFGGDPDAAGGAAQRSETRRRHARGGLFGTSGQDPGVIGGRQWRRLPLQRRLYLGRIGVAALGAGQF